MVYLYVDIVVVDIIVVHLLSCVPLFAPWTAARQACLSFTISLSLCKFMSVESTMPSNHLTGYIWHMCVCVYTYCNIVPISIN